LSYYSCTEDAPLATTKILVTSESGDIQAEKPNVTFQKGVPEGTVIEIFPAMKKQTLTGIEVMQNIFGEEGANFSLTRTHIGACDFSVEGKYSYVDKPGDLALESFTLAPDKEGFPRSKYKGVANPTYDLLPMIKEAQAIKNQQSDKTLNIIASAWTAPSWMKNIETWFIPGGPENNYQGTGGYLKPECEEAYADYIIKYLDEYRKEGVDIWGITPVNEPHGNNGSWESMHFSPASQTSFIKNYLGPKLQKGDNGDTRLLIYDQNRNGIKEWVETVLGDKEAAQYVYGTAIHWYESTVGVHEDVLDEVHTTYPDFDIIHTEGCIDDLGKPAPDGIGDPEGFQEEGWFKNDAFWWNKNATDWGYTAPWGSPTPEDHPMYTPVHRYARNIIVSVDHWLSGWVDWNVVLDHEGGPNHVGNFCGAPIMIDTDNKDVYYTPIYHVLSQLSRTMRPGDQVLQTGKDLGDLGSDDIHACASVNGEGVISVQLLNTTKKAISYSLKIGEEYALINLDANAVQTVQI